VSEPAARVTSVRRTVSVAAALVAGQAVLCAVIGWVTFGGSGQAHSIARAEPDLGPALVVPPASVAPVMPAAPGRKRVPTLSSSPAVSSPTASEEVPVVLAAPPAETPSPAQSPTSAVPPQPPTATSPAPTGNPARATPLPTDSAVVTGVELGDVCELENADGRTKADVLVRCLRDKAGLLVWQLG
jgi:hypothetical protein